MMAMLGQWLGFETSRPTPTPAGPPLVITPSKLSSTTSTSSSAPSATAPLRKTKSDELLRDFEVMRFLATIDERLKDHGYPLSQPDLDRLQTLHAQAVSDQCNILADIIDHFELENDMLRSRSAGAGPADPLAASTCNALVC